MLSTPVLFIVFNRPDITQQVFDKICEARPARLFVAADGPRNLIDSDNDLCRQVRKIVTAKPDWDCQVHYKLSDDNLGCKNGPGTAIDWFFEHVEEGIILEDDCLPNTSFFTFCTQMLQVYKFNEQVMVISGTSFQDKPLDIFSYYFSKYVHIWGWATWKSAWEKFDVELTDTGEEDFIPVLKSIFSTKREQALWLKYFREIKASHSDFWDPQWMFTVWKNNGLCIVPWKNLVTNLGYGEDATHTTMADSPEANLPTFILSNIIHPTKVIVNKKADRKIRYSKFIITNTQRVKNKLRSILSFKK